MSKKWFLVLVPFIFVVLLMSCDPFGTPDYVGTWTATVTSGAASIPVSMEFTETTFTVTVDTIDPGTMAAVKYVITGDLAESATEGSLDATITGISQNGTAMDAATMAGFLAANSLTADQTLAYTVTGESMTISGAMLTALTGAASITATLSTT